MIRTSIAVSFTPKLSTPTRIQSQDPMTRTLEFNEFHGVPKPKTSPQDKTTIENYFEDDDNDINSH
jgi:hypothetical protein